MLEVFLYYMYVHRTLTLYKELTVHLAQCTLPVFMHHAFLLFGMDAINMAEPIMRIYVPALSFLTEYVLTNAGVQPCTGTW